jgi:flavin reductase (DIM6/NTAB) family NADH-FMN oxidoreductase RutF
MTAFSPQTDLRAYRAALGAFATGVTVVTISTDAGPIGITANSFASVSLDPALILWSPAKSSSRFAAFQGANRFAVHVLRDSQSALASAFTRSKDAFDGLDWHISAAGTPVLPDCLARFECDTYASHDAGDHVIILGQVGQVTHGQGTPLVFHGGQFGRFSV